MDESRKKPIMIGIIVVCCGLAALIGFKSLSGGGGGTGSIPSSAKIWVKCNNPACKAEYETGERAFREYVSANYSSEADRPPGAVCEMCGKPSVFEAIKCSNCGVVFFRDAGDPYDYGDRCPECKYSATEESRKKK